jgi:hypothetical protein
LAAREQPRAPHRHADQLLQITPITFPRKSRYRIIQRTAGYGPVCPVVWEGRSRKAPPYPDSRGTSSARESRHLLPLFSAAMLLLPVAAGTGVVWTRWTHRAAFVGPATRARPCRPFFMLRFLAGSSAGTDGSLAGRPWRGLGLSRRNERRAEQRRNDKGRDCKFGSHRNVSVGYTVSSNPGRAIQFQRAANIAQISYSKKSFVIAAQGVHCFSKHPSPSEHRICAKRVQ